MWKWLTDYFDLRRGERRGAAILLSLILVLIAAQFLVKYIIPQPQYDFTKIQAMADDFQRDKGTASENDESQDFFEAERTAQSTLFRFDPNTLDEAGFKKLGLPGKIASNIIKYRSKGGRFRKPEDFRKIYGLTGAKFEELRPYIVIPEAVSPSTASTIVNINTADSAALVSLHGIGPAFASRIIKYRNLLGGFCRKEQLLEVYGLDSKRYKGFESKITVSGPVHKLNINTASLEEMKRHPYLKTKLAAAIIEYRGQHGQFKSVTDLKNINGIDNTLYEKVEAYLEVK
jgi:competence ComEA-like helix-hairpin-helix protein